MELLKDQNIVDLLGCVHKSVMPFYLYYADQKNSLLNFDGFQRFFSDFELFPDVISKPKVFRFFKTLSGFFETAVASEGTDKKIAQSRRDVIDEHLFVEALALTAFEIIY